MLKNAFRGSNLKDAKRQILSENFPDFLALIDDIILDDGKKCKAILSENEYGKVKEKIISQYGELIRRVTPNKVEIKYHGKLLKQHSWDSAHVYRARLFLRKAKTMSSL